MTKYVLLRCRKCNYTIIGSEDNAHEDMINHVEQSHGFSLHKITQFSHKKFYERKRKGLKMLIEGYKHNPKNFAIRVMKLNIDFEDYKMLKKANKTERNNHLINTIGTPAKLL